jgi:hypothetical protein
VDRSRLETCERAQFLLTRMQRRERLTSPCGEQAARLREATAATVPLDETLPGGRLEKAQVLARRRLADADRARSPRNRALPLDLDEEAQARGVPEERE